MLILNTFNFQKKMLPKSLCILIHSLTKSALEDYSWQICSEKFVKFAEEHPWRSLLLRKLQNLEFPLLWTKCSAKYILGIYKIFNITSSINLDCQMQFQCRIISFNYLNFDIDNYRFFSSYEIAVGKNVRQELKQTFYLQFLSCSSLSRSKVQLVPPTVNICRKA